MSLAGFRHEKPSENTDISVQSSGKFLGIILEYSWIPLGLWVF